MSVVLSWNAGLCYASASQARSRLSVLDRLLGAYSPTLVALQEGSADAVRMLVANGYDSESLGNAELIAAWRMSAWLRDGASVACGTDAVGVPLSSSSASRKISLWSVHLVSRLRTQEFTIGDRAQRLANFINNHRAQNLSWASRDEVIAGDFNLQPFRDELWRSSGFGANRSLAWLRRNRRGSSLDAERFNPCWSILGRDTPPLGTIYRTSEADRPWYVFDQVIISPSLAGPPPHVELITAVGGLELCGNAPARRPNVGIGSDHLPIAVRVQV